MLKWKLKMGISNPTVSVAYNKQPNESETVSCLVVSDSVTPWIVAHQAALSTEFSRQEYLSE